MAEPVGLNPADRVLAIGYGRDVTPVGAGADLAPALGHNLMPAGVGVPWEGEPEPVEPEPQVDPVAAVVAKTVRKRASKKG